MTNDEKLFSLSCLDQRGWSLDTLASVDQDHAFIMFMKFTSQTDKVDLSTLAQNLIVSNEILVVWAKEICYEIPWVVENYLHMSGYVLHF